MMMICSTVRMIFLVKVVLIRLTLREEEEGEDELEDTMDFGSFGDDEEGYDNDF